MHKILNPILAILLFLACTMSSAQPGPSLIYVLGGQSNAAGCPFAADLTAAQKSYFYNGWIFSRGDYDSSGWVPVALGQGYQPNRFGPELGFTYNMARNIRIIKHAIAGTSVAEYWAPGNPGYADFITTIQDGLASAPAGSRIAGILFMGCESDANNEAYANALEVNLQAFIAQVRIDLGIPDLPVAIAKIHPYGWPYASTVRATQESVSSATVGFFETSDLALMSGSDHHHYNAASMLQLGLRFANVAKTWGIR